MTRVLPHTLSLTAFVILCTGVSASEKAAEYTRLVLAKPQILAATPAFGEEYAVANILKPSRIEGPRAEYASRRFGTQTHIDFDLGSTERVMAFRHMQRRTPDTVAESNLIFSDTAEFTNRLATVAIKHSDERGATSYSSFAPVEARYVRWQVTAIHSQAFPNVGGQSIEFFTAGPTESQPTAIGIEARASRTTSRQDGKLTQPLSVTLDYPYAEAAQVVVTVEGQEPRSTELAFGRHTLRYMCPAFDSERLLPIAVDVSGDTVASRDVPLKPARELTVYILPHSHTDIGYTAIQTDIEEKQINNLLQGLAAARRTADYPTGARFVWNVEVAWAADLYLQRLSDTQREEFFDAVRCGQVALNGMYLNELTGLCRPEELVRLFRFATQLSEVTGVPVDSAMISDVPGYTWGTVTAMSQAGIRYFSVAPNYFDRIGDILVQWENRPFWWIGPDGQSKVLVWIPFWGYALSHRYGQMSYQLVEDFVEGLENRDYPYEIAYVRWSGRGDNAVPDPAICDFVKDWNATHGTPRFVIASTSEAFRAFEQRYGHDLPQVRGDWTPYWEDGAGSSAAETALNRASSERLSQAETLWAMLNPRAYPAAKFAEAWKHVLLYSEHTWGAHCSISQPAIPFTSDQWNIKQSYATAANLESRQRLSDAASRAALPQPAHPEAHELAEQVAQVDIFNTTSWPRTEIVILPHEVSGIGDTVRDDQGQFVPAQRLVSQELAVLVRDLPPLAGRRYTILPKSAGNEAAHRPDSSELSSTPRATGATLTNDRLRIRLDDKTGGIVELWTDGVDTNLVDTTGGQAVNEYLYLIGDDLAALQKNGPVRITVGEAGPLVASLRVESDAPGCYQLSREIRLAANADHVELIDTLDKKRLEAKSYHAKEGKESVNIAFPFNVPGGELRLDLPLAVMRPESDQIPSACKNWLTVGRWADISNRDFGVTWVTLDAPLVQVGGITATLLNSQTNPDTWRKTIEPSQKLYAWLMNNHWGTNYRAYQEGPTVFRFILRPHRGTTVAEASRFATNFSQPLVAVPGRGAAPPATPLVRIESADVLVSGLKPSDDGRAIIVRLFGASDQTASTKLTWASPQPPRLWLSDTSEQPRHEVVGDVQVPAWGMVTLRAELPK